jgi:hypothetical protein
VNVNGAKRSIDAGTLFTGLILVVIGALFLLDRLHVADFHDVIRTWWPMIIVLVGLPKLFSRATMWSGFWLVAIGVWLQFTHLHVFGMTFNSSWPLLLIALGAGMTLRAVMDAGPAKEEPREP